MIRTEKLYIYDILLENGARDWYFGVGKNKKTTWERAKRSWNKRWYTTKIKKLLMLRVFDLIGYPQMGEVRIKIERVSNPRYQTKYGYKERKTA